jgi:hypothetical protein
MGCILQAFRPFGRHRCRCCFSDLQRNIRQLLEMDQCRGITATRRVLRQPAEGGACDHALQI